MVQNHLLQVLCLVAMEPPVSLDERDLRDRKVDVLRSIRPLTDDDVVRRSRRARYLAGRIGDTEIPAYVDEPGVNQARQTETFAEVELKLDNWRWSGTTFRIRAAKAIGGGRREVAVHFREVPQLPATMHGESNVLRFGLEPESLHLELTAVTDRLGVLSPLTLTTELATAEPARVRPAAAQRAQPRRVTVDPRRRGGGVLARGRPGARRLGAGHRPDGQLSGGLAGPSELR